MKKHRHEEIIKEWLDNGMPPVEFRRPGEDWIKCSLRPSWVESCEYHLVYQPKPKKQIKMLCSELPSAWELWVCFQDKNQGWVRYQLYETHQQAKNTVKRIEGAPLEFKIVPLYSAVTENLPSNEKEEDLK